MNKHMFAGHLVSDAQYFPPQNGKKSRAVMRVAVSRKGKETEIEYVAFSPSSEFIARGLGIIPLDQTGKFIAPNERCFLKGCRVEGSDYVQSSTYVDKNGNQRLGYEFVVEETNSTPFDYESQAWLEKRTRQATQANGNYPNGSYANGNYANRQPAPNRAPVQNGVAPNVAPASAPYGNQNGGYGINPGYRTNQNGGYVRPNGTQARANAMNSGRASAPYGNPNGGNVAPRASAPTNQSAEIDGIVAKLPPKFGAPGVDSEGGFQAGSVGNGLPAGGFKASNPA